MAWPIDPIPGDPRPPWQILNEIVFRAHAGNAPNADLIIYLAFKCAANAHTKKHTDAAQDQHVLNARDAARLGQWFVVASELDHD